MPTDLAAAQTASFALFIQNAGAFGRDILCGAGASQCGTVVLLREKEYIEANSGQMPGHAAQGRSVARRRDSCWSCGPRRTGAGLAAVSFG
ncbi:hypothetical protein WM16_08415 [Burkholderia ubonensis]|uniref:Uncharacterized protein n=1 Tax=Burkholderia ubonensis TaxID=101571 RepID=A0A108CRR3_9BURK|nr:hypothetical protein WM16_08415 [Burkholderia ubonensis]